jgi:hypothetical protein
VFNISDHELDGIEAKAKRPEQEQRAYAPMPGYEGYGGYGDDTSTATPAPMPAPPPVALPMPAPPSGGSVATGAGSALALATVGLVTGAIAAGAWGAACGVTTVGALRNLWRTKALWNSQNPGDRSEAGKSATMGILGLGIAGMIGYHAYTIRGDTEKEAFPW